MQKLCENCDNVRYSGEHEVFINCSVPMEVVVSGDDVVTKKVFKIKNKHSPTAARNKTGFCGPDAKYFVPLDQERLKRERDESTDALITFGTVIFILIELILIGHMIYDSFYVQCSDLKLSCIL